MQTLEIAAQMRAIVTTFFDALSAKVEEIQHNKTPSVVNDQVLKLLTDMGGENPWQFYSEMGNAAWELELSSNLGLLNSLAIAIGKKLVKR